MDSFGRVETFLLTVSHHIATSQLLCEMVCKDLKLLLNQPWPTKDKTSPKLGTSPTAEDNTSNHGDSGMSKEEAETLARVERTLLRAQKARKLHEKLNPVENVARSKTDEPDEGTLEPPPTQLINGQEFAVISQSTLRKIFPKEKPDGGRRTTTVKPGTAQARAAYSASIRKPGSSAKSRFRTSAADIGKYAATHNKPSSNPSTRHDSVGRKQSSTGRMPVKCPASTRTTNLTSAVGEQDKDLISCRNKNAKVKSNPTSDYRDNNHTSRSKNLSSGSVVREKPADEMDDLVARTDSMEVADGVPSGKGLCTVDNKRTGDEASKEFGSRPFILRKDDANLRVPTRLRRLQTDIDKLRQKLGMSRRTSEDDSVPSRHFMHRLESRRSSRVLSPSEVGDRMEDLKTECIRLKEITKTAAAQFQGTSDNSPWASKYRLKVLSQSLRQRVNDLRKGIEDIVNVEIKMSATTDLRHECHHVHQPACSPTATHPSTMFYLPVQEFQGCTYQMAESLPSCGGWQYSKLSDMQEITRLQHTVQELSLQVKLERIIGEEILPLVQRLDPSDRSFLSLYRSVFGLLCHGGRLYPAIVADNVSNTSHIDGS